MAISSGASDGVRCTTAAKESVGSAATLGSQASAAANEVIVPTAIGTNNEGNLESTPSYVGRMIAIRPWEMKLAAATLQGAGSGYVATDVLTLNGVAGVGGAPQITVDTVDGGGAITGFSITRDTAVEIRMGGMTSAPSPADDPVGHTGGTGTGATFNCTWAPHFEIRFITADASNTLTVHEDWEVAPVSGDNWAVSYILEDMATLTGCTLRAQSGVFEFTRSTKVGPSTDGTRRGWLSINDGKQMEMDNTTADTFLVEDGGILTVGYLSGGQPVNGGYMSTSNTAGADMDLSAEGALYYLYDWQMRSPREQLQVMGLNASSGAIADANNTKFHFEVGTEIRGFKLFDCSNLYVGCKKISEGIVQKGGSGSNMQIFINDDFVADGETPTTLIDDVTLVGIPSGQGVTNVSGSTDHWSRNLTFVNCTSLFNVVGSATHHTVNPSWPTLVLTDFVHFDLSDFVSVLSAYHSVDAEILDVSGTPSTTAVAHVYVGANRRNTSVATFITNSATVDASGNVSMDVEVEWFAEDLQTTGNYGGQVTDIALKIYDYGFSPTVTSLTHDFTNPLTTGDDLQVTLLADSAITEADQATALTNPTTAPTITRHGVDGTDTRPMKAMNYDAGTGGVAPTLGETITGGTSTATGDVVEVIGDDVSGTVLLENWNGTEFQDNENITGGTSAFDATSNTAGFYSEYTIELNGQGEAGTIIYDYLAARMAQETLTAEFEQVMEWSGKDPNATQLMYLGTNGYYTPRSQRFDWCHLTAPGVDFSDDFNRADENLSVSANWNDVDASAGTCRVVSNQLAPGTTTANLNIAEVDTSAFSFGSTDRFIRATVAAMPSSGGELYLWAAIDTTANEAVGVRITSTGTVFFEQEDISTAAGSTIWRSSTTWDTVAASDVITLCYRNGTLLFFINDDQVFIWRPHPSRTVLSGQPGIGFGNVQSSDAARFDDVEFGEIADADIHQEGVWLHNRGGGTFDYFTADDGTQYTVPATTTVTFTNIKDDTEVRVYATGTTTEIAGTENATTGSPDDRSFAWSADAGTVVDYVLINVAGWQIIRVEGYTVPSSNTSLPIQQVIERNYSNP